MRLRQVSVRGLFGSFDHDISFPPEGRVVIVHGPNGFGKTVVLRMVEALARGDVTIFLATPFKEFSLSFDDGSKRVVSRHGSTSDMGAAALQFSILTADGEMVPDEPAPIDVPKEVLDQIDRWVPSWGRWKDGWRDSAGTFRSLAEVLAAIPSIRQRVPKSARQYLTDRSIKGLNVFFVRTDRLLSSEPISLRSSRNRGEYYLVDDEQFEFAEQPANRHGLRVEQYSTAIVRLIQSVLAGYAKHSQESDRTFPERLVRFLRSNAKALTEREILSQMAVLEEKRQRLVSLGFLDKESGLSDLTEDDIKRAREALTIYVHDIQEKFKVFDDLALRIGMLTDIANGRLRYKTLKIDRERGFQIVGDTAGPVALSDLSSGEQHELVLLYELLFLVSKNDLVLIDEPEISLHVAWQTRFLQDLIAILDLTDAYAIVATHAPAIIGTHWDLAIPLTGPGGNVVEADA